MSSAAHITSQDIARVAGTNATQVRRDLSQVFGAGAGKRGTGYQPEQLAHLIRAKLSLSGVTGSGGVALIDAERRRQVLEEGWSAAHDDTHDDGDLAAAGAAYALTAEGREGVPHSRPADGGDGAPDFYPVGWPWNPTPDDRIRELVKAGALIAAEIDRLNRAVLTKGAR